MARYHVFLGAPTPELPQDSASYRWEISTSTDGASTMLVAPLTSSAYETASQCLSNVYKGAIFGRDEDESLAALHISERWADRDDSNGTLDSNEWSQSLATRLEISVVDKSITKELPDNDLSATQHDTFQSIDDSNCSNYTSIGRFPIYRFGMYGLHYLHRLLSPYENEAQNQYERRKRTHNVAFLAAVLEVDGPVTFTVKQGPYVGTESAFLSLIVGDEDGGIVKITAWRETAENWGGGSGNEAIRKGDVVHFKDVMFNESPPASPTVTANPKLGSTYEICYRTLAVYPSDRKFQPDLQLGWSDTRVRMVASVVKWVERSAGLKA